MKILVLGDPHGKLPQKLNSLIKKNKIDVIVCVGDIPPVPQAFRKGKINYFPKKFIEKADNLFRKIVKKLCSYKIPVLVLRGNMYYSGRSERLTKSIFNKYKNLYYKQTGKFKINNINFILFDFIWEVRRDDLFIKKQIKSNPIRERKLNKLLKENSNSILITHNSPYGYLDKTPSGGHIGSRILLKAIKKHKPKLVLCGHIHEAKGKAKIGKSVIYNLGSQGDYKIIDTDKEVG